MADQDFNINIRTTADTSGIAKTEAALKGLNASIAQQLAAAGVTFDPATGTFKSIKAPPAPPAPPAPVLPPMPTPPGEASDGAGGTSFSRLIKQFIGVGALLGFIDSLKRASAEIEKISDELSQQGEQLVKHAQLYDEQARHAKDAGDVLKISNATLKDIEDTQKKVNELQQQEVGIVAKISDYMQVQLLARQKHAEMGDYEAARQQNLATAEDQARAARQRAMDELLDAEEAANQTYEERLEILNREIAAEEKRKQAALDATDPGGYAKAANNLLKLNQHLNETIQLEEKRRTQERREADATAAEREKDVNFLKEQVGGASPQAQRILMNEMAASRARALGQDASMFERSAEAFRRGATPGQLEEAKVLQALLEQNRLMAQLLDQWQ